MPTKFQLLLIADVGVRRHIGDEAMLEANLASFRRLIPNLSIAIMSSDPSWVASRYGVEGVPLFGFPSGYEAEPERRAVLRHLLEVVEERGRNQTIDVIAAADAVVISGGGNLSSTWPHLLYERVALLEIAHLSGKPAVVLGQTIGPRVDDLDQLLANALVHARYVGVREIPSAMLAMSLGVPAHRICYQCDDALLPDEEDAAPAHAPAIAVTIDPQVRATSEALFDSLAGQLRNVSATTGLPLLLLPHVYGDEHSGGPSDLIEARLLAARMQDAAVTIAEDLDADETRRLTSSAAIVISTRFHPIVFAFSSGVPALGIYGDDYCRIKLQGVFAHARLDAWTLTYDDVANGALQRKALDLWSRREDMRRHLDDRRTAWRVETRERWSAVLRALAPAVGDGADSSKLFGIERNEMGDVLARAFEAQRQWSDAEQAAIVASYLKTQRKLIEELGPRRTLARYVTALRSRLQRRDFRFGRKQI